MLLCTIWSIRLEDQSLNLLGKEVQDRKGMFINII